MAFKVGINLFFEELTMIIADNLNIGYKDKIVVHDLSFTLDKGMFVALIGANGAGKSTLINSLIGVIPPVSGQIAWKLQTDRTNPFNDVGFSPQSQLIDWYTSVYDNVYQGPLLAGFKLKDAKKATVQALKLLAISDLSSKPVDHISGGQQQRVQIAREIARKPQVYILDEPTTGLDVETSESLFTYLKQRVDDGCIVFASSHDLTLLENYASHVLFLDEHEQKYFGPLTGFLDSGTSLREKYLNERKAVENESAKF